MPLLLELYHAVQACGSVYAGLLSIMAIYNLQQWEPQAETASKYSNMASQQLSKTRTTQASGALATLSSLASSTTCVIILSSGTNMPPFFISIVNAGGIFLAYRYIGDFWRNKAKAPLATTYNDGVRMSQQLLQALGVLSLTWAVVTPIHLYRAMAN